MRIREGNETEWQEKPANSQYGPEFELETKYLMRTPKPWQKYCLHLLCNKKVMLSMYL